MVYFSSSSLIESMVQPATAMHVGAFRDSRFSEIQVGEINVNSHRNHHRHHPICHDNMDRRDQPENMEIRGESFGRREAIANAESGRRDLERGDNIGETDFYISRKLLRRRHILKERRERREEKELAERMTRKRTREETPNSVIQNPATKLRVNFNEQEKMASFHAASSPLRPNLLTICEKSPFAINTNITTSTEN